MILLVLQPAYGTTTFFISSMYEMLICENTYPNLYLFNVKRLLDYWRNVANLHYLDYLKDLF